MKSTLIADHQLPRLTQTHKLRMKIKSKSKKHNNQLKKRLKTNSWIMKVDYSKCNFSEHVRSVPTTDY